jgi:hypothetical protein
MGGAVLEMEACWPCGVVLWGRAPNHPVLRWLKTVVVSDRGEGALDRVRWGPGRRSRKRPARGSRGGCALLRRRWLNRGGVESGGSGCSLVMSLAGVPVTGRVVPGVKAA